MRKLTQLFIATILALSFYTGCEDDDGGGNGQGAPTPAPTGSPPPGGGVPPGGGAPAPAPVPQTGQTTCWDSDGNEIACAGTGQDGDIRAGVEWPSPRFRDNGDGTIRDNLTGLIWLQDANCFGSATWAQALEDANTLKTDECGLSDGSDAGDWRLPNALELASLFDFENPNPALPPGHPFIHFPTDPPDFWSSTTYSPMPNLAWLAGFFVGGVGPVEKMIVDERLSTFVLPVRSEGEGGEMAPAPVPQTGQTTCWDSLGQVIACAGTGQDGQIRAGVEWPVPRFTDNGDGTIRDNLTGLIWLKDANCFGGDRTWAEALTDANTLSAGKCGLMDESREGDWRLANLRELMSLVDFENSDPALPTVHPFVNFQSSMESLYWSSTTDASDTFDALLHRFFDGIMGVSGLKMIDQFTFFVLPVRGGS